jgi:hypothetical protein
MLLAGDRSGRLLHEWGFWQGQDGVLLQNFCRSRTTTRRQRTGRMADFTDCLHYHDVTSTLLSIVVVVAEAPVAPSG